MLFEMIKWNSIDELIDKIKVEAMLNNPNLLENDQQDCLLEVERKWIIDPKLIDLLKSGNINDVQSYRNISMLQGYLSIDPEIRYRST